MHDLGIIDRLDSLISLFEDPPNVLHFAGHYIFAGQRGPEITLAGGPLRPSDLAWRSQTRSLAAASPLVFLNICRPEGDIPGFVQMVGWASSS